MITLEYWITLIGNVVFNASFEGLIFDIAPLGSRLFTLPVHLRHQMLPVSVTFSLRVILSRYSYIMQTTKYVQVK